jgi:hypothetical protein
MTASGLGDLAPDDGVGFVIFGNEQQGCAVANARTLRRLTGAETRPRAIETYPRPARPR